EHVATVALAGFAADACAIFFRGHELAPPAARAALHIEGDHRIGAWRILTVVRLGGRRIDEPAPDVDAERRVDRAAGRSEVLRTVHTRLRTRLWRLFDCVALPEKLAARRIERRDAATVRTAGIARVMGERIFHPRNRDEHAAFVNRRGRSDARQRMRLDRRLPQLRAARRIERSDGALIIAEEDGGLAG